jgi:AbrB family transcriptional regulator (stage V sporulation protein T)
MLSLQLSYQKHRRQGFLYNLQILQSRQTSVLNSANNAKTVPITQDDRGDQYTAQVIVPILADGEIIGGLMLLSRESGVRMGDIDQKVAETTATIIGRQMEQ